VLFLSGKLRLGRRIFGDTAICAKAD
jgi:hypothetical protein